MPTAVAPIRPLAWEPPYATGATLKKQKTNKQKPEFELATLNRNAYFNSELIYLLYICASGKSESKYLFVSLFLYLLLSLSILQYYQHHHTDI